ncbi:Pyruvate kinase [bacterium HR34]|nr:Pyruvate kinase [bacterium HR34]
MTQSNIKIVATIGPATESKKAIRELIKLGVNVFRFNLKHNDLKWHKEKVILVKEVAKSLNRRIAVLIDLQGPQVRLYMPFDKIEVKIGEEVLFDQSVFKVKKKGFFITHPQIVNFLKPNDFFVVDDGRYFFHLEKRGNKFVAVSHQNCIIENKKSINFPEIDFSLKAITKRDVEAIKMLSKTDVDFVALSFVRYKKDIDSLKKIMKRYGMECSIVSKIETRKAIDNLDEIIENSDGIMVARGDLGVELPVEKVPFYQKLIIKRTLKKNKFVIAATQFLQSMIKNRVPTRAEISDIANTVYDLTDSIMLSGETAYGDYPFDAVKILQKTISFNEKLIDDDTRKRFDFKVKGLQESVCASAYEMYLKMKENLKSRLAGFLIFTRTGQTAKLVSRYHPLLPIFTITQDEKTANSLVPYFGVRTFVDKRMAKKAINNLIIRENIKKLKSKKLVKKNQFLITLHDDIWEPEGGTTTIRIVKIK